MASSCPQGTRRAPGCCRARGCLECPSPRFVTVPGPWLAFAGGGGVGVTRPSSVPGASLPPLRSLEQGRQLSLGCLGGAGRVLGVPRASRERTKFESGSVSTAVGASRVAAGRGRGLGPPGNGAAGTGCISLGFNMSPKSPDGPVWVSAGQRAGRHVAPALPFLAAGRLRSGFIGELQTGFAQRRRCRSPPLTFTGAD